MAKSDNLLAHLKKLSFMRNGLTYLILAFLLVFPNAKASAQLDPEKIYQVAVYDLAPYGFTTNEGFFEGVMVELWREIAEDLEIRYKFKLTDMDGLVSGLNDGTYDLAIGAITVTKELEESVDFSNAVSPSGITTIVTKKKLEGKFSTYYKPILKSLFNIAAILGAFMLASATIVWLVERKHRFHEREKQIRHLGDGIWWSAVTISTVGYGDKVPHTTIGRIVGIAWIFVGITMVSLFTANAAAILSKPAPTLEITEHDLSFSKVGALRNSAAAEYLDRVAIDYQEYDQYNEAIEEMEKGEIEVIVGTKQVMRYLITEVYPKELLMAKNILSFNNIAFAFKHDSPTKEAVNGALLRHINEPQWQRILFKDQRIEN